MGNHAIRRGLDLPITGRPEQDLREGRAVTRVAVLGQDFPTMKPRMAVEVGARVKRGQLIFDDRKTPGVRFTAPGAGEVVAIHRGEKRTFQALVIELSSTEAAGTPTADEQVVFDGYKAGGTYSGEELRALLVESGLWPALRVRPYEKSADPTGTPAALFVTATDSNPLAPSPAVALKGREEDFKKGLSALTSLLDGPVYLCVGDDWTLDCSSVGRVRTETFTGPHPSGLVGTHIHMLAPVHRDKRVWHIGYQDVAAVGHLLATGHLDVSRVVSLAGPAATTPRLVRTRLGASVPQLMEGEVATGEVRLVSGSVLYGQTAMDETTGFLGRFHNQVSALMEDRERVFLGWLAPGADKFSTLRAYLSRWLPQKDHALTTTTNGSHRAMVPIGMFERVMPLDVMPTFLLRSLIVGDIERSIELGALELAEEDLALCSFVSPGKEDYGKALRNVLTDIWREG
jgi:Na+-transporting NADH:ubiquinone oxidoreductase subunit A